MKPANMTRLQQTSEALKVMAHPLRLQIIQLLSKEPVSVGELAGACRTSRPMVSAHLRLLNNRGLVRKERRGRQVFYRVTGPAYGQVIACLGK